MRMLTLDEVGFVSGGDDEPMQEVVVNGRRMSPEDIQNMMDFLGRHTQMDGGGSGTPRGGVWWAAAIAIVVTEAKDFFEEYLKETTGYENAQEWLKDQLDEMGRTLVDNTCGTMSNGKTVAPKPCGVPARD
jgi:hypothetical protein